MASTMVATRNEVYERLHATGLTDTQLASVRRAAALLRPGERSQFLQAIAYELADVDPIDDEAVKGAVEAIMDAAARR